jgi:PKD repeat protein
MVAKGNAFGNQYFGFGSGYHVNYGSSFNPIIYLSGDNYRYFSPKQDYGNYQLHSFGFADGAASPATTYLSVNNTPLTPVNGADGSGFQLNNLSIGAGSLNGEILEILVYNTQLTDSLREDIGAYLSTKYAPPVELGSSIAIGYGFADTTITAYRPHFTSYLWSDGSTDSAISVSQAGTYAVTVTNIFGVESSDGMKVTYPTIGYPVSGNDTTLCLGDTLIWDTGLGSGYHYVWQGSGLDASKISLTAAGVYSVRVADSLGQFILSDTLTIFIDSFPSRNSLGLPRSVCRNEAVGLALQGEGISSYLWSTGSTNSYINIGTAGDYSVTVTNMGGCTDRDTNTYGISGEAPVVLFAADTVCSGDSTTFIDQSTITTGTIDSYSWSFGNGSTSLQANPKHLYQAADTFLARLTAASGACSSFYEDSIVVRARPEAGFDVLWGTRHCTGSFIQFTDTSQTEVPVSGYLWQFGDGNSSTLQNPAHQYLLEGSYNAQLKTTNAIGCSDSLLQVIQISDEMPLSGGFSLSSPPGSYLTYDNTPIEFSWGASNNAIYYRFEIARDAGFTAAYFTDSIQTTGYGYQLPDSGTWFWRVKAFNVCHAETLSGTQEVSYRKLPSVGLKAWYKADSVHLVSGGYVDTLYDVSGNGVHARQPNSASRPVWSGDRLNGYPSLAFDGNDLLDTDSLKAGTAEIFMVAKGNAFGNQYFGFGSGYHVNYGSSFNPILYLGNSNYLYFSPKQASGQYQLHCFGFADGAASPATSFMAINNQALAPANGSEGSGFVLENLKIGASSLNGEVLEVLVYDNILGDSAKGIITDYIRYKYAPPINLSPEINIQYGFADTTISAYKPWFTSYNWSTGPTDSAITVSQSGTYSVTATDIFGFTSSDSVVVTYPQPINITDTVICQYDTVTWNLGIKGNYSYLWSTGGTASELNITETGDYWLVIQDTLGNPWYSDTVTVVVNDFPSRISLGNDTTLCKGNRLYLQNGMEAVVDYLWNDGSANDFITINEAGTYSVMVSDNMGCVGYDTVVLDVKGIAPNPDFTALNFCLNDTVQFLDASTSPDGSEIIQWDWNFGDGNTSAGNETTHQYLEPGSYPVTLQIQSASLCTNSIQKQVDVFHLPEPAFLPLTACSNAAVPFYDKSMSRDGVVTSWNWLFPDGSGSILQNPEFTFASTGTKQIQLVVTTNLGCKDTLWKSIEIKQGPATGFSYSAACVGYPVYFTDQTVSFMNLPLVYEWTINGEPFSFESSPMYQFNSSGTVDVKLQTSQSTNGCSSSKSEQIVVHKNPEVGFDIPMICAKNPNTFEGIIYDSEGEIHLWKWLLNQQPAFDTKDIEFRYDTAGIYHAVLMVEDVYGCRDTSQNPFEVFDIPVPLFTASVEKGPVPLEIQFTNHSQGADTYYWQFGDGGSSTDIEPQHTYIDSGQFQIQLTAYSPIGCADSVFSLVKGIIPMVDVAAAEIQTEQSNGFLKVRVLIQNLGTIDLDEMVVSYKTNNSQEFREVINQTFPSGKSLWYEFKTQVALDENQPLTHVCVALSLKTTADEYLSNNETCKAFENAFKTLNPYPNPASEKLVVEFIIPFDAQVSIQLFDGFGKKNELLFEGTTQAGFCRKVFDISGLEAGIYFYKITYEGNTHAYQFMVK